MKKQYEVLVKKRIICEDPDDNISFELGKFKTYAVSKEKAINNVRFRIAGYSSQYKPVAVYGKHDDFFTYEVTEVKNG